MTRDDVIEDILNSAIKPPYLADRESFEEHARCAQISGKEVLVASDYQLFLDLDFKSDSILRHMFTVTSALSRQVMDDVLESNQVVIVNKEFTRSSSGNIHSIITLDKPLDEPVRIALEMALGSDLKRGALNSIRYSFGLRGVSRLFRPLPLQYIEL
jgi:hypothetical protein